MFVHYGLTFCLVAWVSVCMGDDVVVQMFSRTPINVISDKYISYSIDPTELLEMNQENEESFLYRMMESGPCYLKIYGNNTNRMRLDGDSIDLNASKLPLVGLRSVYEVLRAAGIRPVIALPYDPRNWNTRNVMRILGKVSMLEMNDITWQLGADFRAKDAISYIDDLNTLRLIVGAFSTKKNRKNWSVVGSDLTLGSSEDEARIYSEFSKYTVDAVGWSQSIDLSYSDDNLDDFFSSLNVDAALRTVLNGDRPVWLSLIQKNSDSKNPLTQMKQGLNWAQTLGDAARNGFKAIYTPINKRTWYEPSMSYYTTLLHKRIMGQIVFDTKMFSGNRFDSHFYAHCTKNMSGSFTVFGVNAGDSPLDISAKLPFRSGTQFVEFVLTVGLNGKVYLNGAEIIEPTVLTPVPRTKLPGKGALLSMPAHSVAFWVFTGASIPECASVDLIEFDSSQTDEKTSSARLLQQLILETVSRDENTATDENAIKRSKREVTSENGIDKHGEYNAIEASEANSNTQTRDKRFIGDGRLINFIYNEVDDLKRRNLLTPLKQKMGIPGQRMKRDISMLKSLLDKFDLKKPAFSFKTPSLKFGAKSLIPSITTVHDVLNPVFDSQNQEKKIFEPVENAELPSGDVHFELAESVPQQGEYAASVAAGNQVVSQYVQETPSVDMPVGHTFDAYNNAGVPNVQSSVMNAVPSTVSLGELTEVAAKSDLVTPPAPVQPAKVQPIQHQLQYVVNDLPPTWKVNLQKMEEARNNLRQNLWPMSNMVSNANSKPTASFYPSVGQAINIQPPQGEEHVFFESRRRRRRAIDSRMNEEIERRLQREPFTTEADFRLSRAVDQSQQELLDKMLKMIENLERHENNVHKSGGSMRKMPAYRQDEKQDSDVPKKCKVLSMTMEQQCLQAETQPRALFKRAVSHKRSSGPLVKIFELIKDTVENPLKLRNKRSILDMAERKNANENSINAILKDSNEVKVPRKVAYQSHRYDISKTQTKTTTQTTTTTTEETTSPDPEPKMKKILRKMDGMVKRITSSVARHVGNWWLALY